MYFQETDAAEELRKELRIHVGLRCHVNAISGCPCLESHALLLQAMLKVQTAFSAAKRADIGLVAYFRPRKQ